MVVPPHHPLPTHATQCPPHDPRVTRPHSPPRLIRNISPQRKVCQHDPHRIQHLPIERKERAHRQRRIRAECPNQPAAHCFGMLYAKLSCSTIWLPLNSAGSGGNGVDALIAAIAARSSDSAPDATGFVTRLTDPFLAMINACATLPRSPSRALSGYTASQLRLIVTSIWLR